LIANVSPYNSKQECCTNHNSSSEAATNPSELTTNATGIENMVSGNEGADLAQVLFLDKCKLQ
jgi:hypothetical protein